MPTQSKYDREIATIKADVAAMGHLFSKLDDAMDKIGTASANISSILAVHDERIDNAEKLVLHPPNGYGSIITSAIDNNL